MLERCVQFLVHRLAHPLELVRVVPLDSVQALLDGIANFLGTKPLLFLHARKSVGELGALLARSGGDLLASARKVGARVGSRSRCRRLQRVKPRRNLRYGIAPREQDRYQNQGNDRRCRGDPGKGKSEICHAPPSPARAPLTPS